ncbi:hypothetical protein FDUTEX481_04773 [Tolypothrix sp. PCC 7601]|nr:hypothetical protein FDUTEX481_04773 [Tolypothrix sp. PCC 7601]
MILNSLDIKTYPWYIEYQPLTEVLFVVSFNQRSLSVLMF